MGRNRRESPLDSKSCTCTIQRFEGDDYNKLDPREISNSKMHFSEPMQSRSHLATY